MKESKSSYTWTSFVCFLLYWNVKCVKRNVMSSIHIPEFVEIPEEDKLFSVYSKQCHMWYLTRSTNDAQFEMFVINAWHATICAQQTNKNYDCISECYETPWLHIWISCLKGCRMSNMVWWIFQSYWMLSWQQLCSSSKLTCFQALPLSA